MTKWEWITVTLICSLFLFIMSLIDSLLNTQQKRKVKRRKRNELKNNEYDKIKSNKGG
jgi:uncharacterized membrane protein